MELEIVLELLIQPVAPPTAQSTFNNYSEGKCTIVGCILTVFRIKVFGKEVDSYVDITETDLTQG